MLSKMTPAVIELWAQVLDAVPGSRLILKNKSLGAEKAQERYQRLFADHGITSERLELLHWSPSSADHLSLYGRIDIALDTFPYNGTTTTCEALWMGVPVITLAGSVHAARVGCSILNQLGLTEMIAKNPETYVSLAKDLAHDRGRLVELRTGLRLRMKSSPLMDAKGFCRDLETVYRDIWNKWVDGGKASHQRLDK
jgi:predicted O-linked N-acetylglucosamine transferase (SPINDLY family)